MKIELLNLFIQYGINIEPLVKPMNQKRYICNDSDVNNFVSEIGQNPNELDINNNVSEIIQNPNELDINNNVSEILQNPTN